MYFVHPAYDYVKMWYDVFFELGIGVDSNSDVEFEIEKGGFSGNIYRNNSIIAKFTTKEKMFLNYSTNKRAEEFIEMAKVIFNEILKRSR